MAINVLSDVLLRVTTTLSEQSALVAIEGALDSSSIHHLERELADIAQTGVPHVILDISRLRFIDAVGFSSMVRATNNLRTAGSNLVVQTAQSNSHLRMPTSGR